jgi:ribosomal protein S18 acetylase RimI-like enzyme
MWWRRESRQQRAGEPEAAQASERSGRPAPAVTLRAMTEAEYDAFRIVLEEQYARDTARARDIPLEEAHIVTGRQVAEQLKDGLATEGHHLWKVVSEQAGPVGDLWIFVDPTKCTAFIYDIAISEQYRGKGYGKAAMLAVEAAVRPMGAARIDLNVFGYNTTARRLYEGLGYEPIAIGMRKAL